MRLIRYSLAGSRTVENGCVEGQKIFAYAGNPLSGNLTRGAYVCELTDVKLLAPCLPPKIICVAINFSGIEGFSQTMKEPLVFVKPNTCLANPGDTIENPFPDLPWWGEAELTVVIKDRIRNISESEASNHILGFTIANDTTVENVEHRDHHLARSKCPDNFCSLGPWIDTEFDTKDCIIEAVQNGEVIRRGRSSQQFWQWPRIISEVSKWMTLEPWDIILTGNPPDTVGMRFLSDGDTYTARILGLGELTNKFFLRKG